MLTAASSALSTWTTTTSGLFQTNLSSAHGFGVTVFGVIGRGDGACLGDGDGTFLGDGVGACLGDGNGMVVPRLIV